MSYQDQSIASKYEYKIFFEDDIYLFNDHIKKYLNEGWQPHGGLNIICRYMSSEKDYAPEYRYCQALIKTNISEGSYGR